MRYGSLVRLFVVVACGAWFVAFGWDEPHSLLVAAPVVVASIAVLGIRTRVSAVLIILAQAITLIAGAAWGNVELVLPVALVLFVLGRADPAWWPGPSVATICAALSAMRDGFSVGKLVIIGTLYATWWLFGAVVRRRAAGAYRALAHASELARQDPDLVSARLAVAAREQLADKAIVAIREAIMRMQRAARAAVDDLQPDAVRAVHDCGVAAVAELGALLGLLREPTAVESVSEPSQIRPRRDLYIALGCVLVWVMVVVTMPGLYLGAGVIVLYAGTILAIGLRQLYPVIACAIAAVASAIAAFNPPDVPELLLPAAAGYALIAWQVTSRDVRAAWPALAHLIAAAIAVSWSYGPRGTAFVLLIFAASILAGQSWHERDRILRGAVQETEGLQAQLRDATMTAMRAERLSLARELHDVTSHSVGAMVMQASAARALHQRAPDDARAALRTVIATSERALSGVDELRTALDGDEFGLTWLSYADASGLNDALERLAADMRVIGMSIDLELGEMPTTPVLAATVFRVVHEGLTNAARHAPGANVTVSVAHAAGTYSVRVSDDGTQMSDISGFGFGLAGLRERVHALDGQFTAGQDDGGFTIEAILPQR